MGQNTKYLTSMEEGFILLQGLMLYGGVPPPFDMLKICINTYDTLSAK